MPQLDFMTLNILKLDFFHIPWFHNKLEASLQKFVEKHQFYAILSCFSQIQDNYVFNKFTCTLLNYIIF